MLQSCTSPRFRLLLATLSVAGGSGFLIYSTYVTNNVQIVGEQWLNESFYATHGYWLGPERVTFLWAAVIASKEVGKICGTILIPWVAENFGRKGGLLINNLVTFLGCLLCYLALTWPYFTIMIGRFLLGVSMICGVGLASLFLIEVAPLERRGSSGALIQIFRGFAGSMGMILTLPEIMGTPTLWTLALALPAIPALFQFVVLVLSKESPRHLLITEGRVGKAASAIEFYQGKSAVGKALEELQSEKQRIQQQSKIGLKGLLQTKNFWGPVLLTSLLLTNRSLAGILPVQTYSTDMFVATGLSANVAAYSTVVLGLCHLVSALLVTFTVERYGRRPMLLYGNFACCVSLCAVALFSALSRETVSARYFTVISLSAFMLFYPIVASVSNIAASEICHQKIRSTAFTVGLLCYSIVGFISTFAYPILKHSLGLALSFAPSCMCLVLTMAIYALYLPETKGKTFESLAFGSTAELVSDEDKKPLLIENHCEQNGGLTLAEHFEQNGGLSFEVEDEEGNATIG